MSAEKPDYHDADLVLRMYEMRREAKTREARDLLNLSVLAQELRRRQRGPEG